MHELTLLEKVFLKYSRPMSSPFVSVSRKKESNPQRSCHFSVHQQSGGNRIWGFTAGLCPFKFPHCDHSDVETWASRQFCGSLC